MEIMGKLAKMSGLKFDIERFDWKINFNIWQSNVKDVLVQQGKPESMAGDKWEELEAEAVSIIRLVWLQKLNSVLNENSPSTLWAKLEKIYMSNSLTNRLYLKK